MELGLGREPELALESEPELRRCQGRRERWLGLELKFEQELALEAISKRPLVAKLEHRFERLQVVA